MILQDGSLKLRPFQIDDKEDLARLADNKHVWDNLRDVLPHPYQVSDAEHFILSIAHDDPQLVFAIKYQSELCGVIGLVKQTDVYRLSAEIGYWLGEPYWGIGIATRAVRLVTDYAFKTLGFHRVYAGIFEYNKASMRVLEKNGFGMEGIFKQSIIKNGKIWDEHRYAKVNPC